MKWFGSPWPSLICQACPRVPVPAGKLCQHCGEAIGANDSGVVYSDGLIAHRSCFLRAVAGAAEGDPPGMTKRQLADAIIWRMLGTSSETRT